ncbi:hypothetical protein DYB38_011619 [Aphanomyces astaci]|uniref:PiggyBac transposable element-derived protein domain-containing protein n=1 Tax=Aphanomyces astaci TaxID=112090 RepID=A0A397DQU8_APHAT|nr:hypothetical protein DYB38_011619 [Aphanomyces astaci]
MRVAFRPLGKPEIVGNDPKLKKLYADTAGFWLEGLVRETTMRKVVVPAVEASVGKKGRTAKTMTEFVSLHTVNWLDTRFNAHAPRICMATMLKGIANYARLKATKSFNKSRTYVKICAYEPEPLELSAVDMQELNAEGNDEEGSTDEYFVDEGNDTSGSSDEDFSEYVDRTWKKKATISTNDIEGLENVRWEYDAKCIGPQDLYEHDDGTTAPVDIKIRPQFEDLFVDPTRALIPLDFWQMVLAKTNVNAHKQRDASVRGHVGGRPFVADFKLNELMKFVGILIMMSVVRAGEYRLYWNSATTSAFMMPDGKTVRSVMSIDRFKAIRACLTFNDVEVKEDPLWRLRPLINLLKASFKMFVVAGREISVDEASIPCRSSHARALIVYNPMKPLGKYHFRIYTAACATSWYVHSFKIHSKASSNFDTLDDQDFGKDDANSEEGSGEAEQMKPSTVRQHVLDITKQWEGSRRVVNMDNWYTSVQLCLTLSAMGMYCRGTVRGNRAHNPRFAMFNKNEVQSNTRGHSRMAYVPEHKMVAVS